MVNHGGIIFLSVSTASEIDSLLDVSARIGRDPLLVQAATGNTSIKLDGVLWIKASGKWLSRATQDEILIPVDLPRTRERIARDDDPAGETAMVGGQRLGTSVETAMHTVLPQRVVLHVHSVNAIAWAVRKDGRTELASRLAGLEWQWIPYVPSGLPLAKEISAAVARFPGTRVLVLANHGLVICGETCAEAEELLWEVEQRVAVEPRPATEPAWALLEGLADHSHWQAPPSAELHSMATDEGARRNVCGGILYPCQTIFLTLQALSFPQLMAPECLAQIDEPFVLIEGAGVLVRKNANPTQSATLAGLAQVLRRIPEEAPVEYLREDQVRNLLCADVYHYRAMVEHNGGKLSSPSGV
jgi:rhamnose utilization protein RhaD (predicted bifunctional aldolase and dehydrogenase)